MRVAGDLGFSSLVLVVMVCVVVTAAIGFVIRRKWLLAVARKEEINRLLILAAEETARAEREESYSYVYSTAVVPTTMTATKINECVVCYFPATAHYAKGKSVLYWKKDSNWQYDWRVEKDTRDD